MVYEEDAIAPPETLPMIALLTDFGLSDAYVGVMKAVILSICPTALIVDLTHDIQPQNVKQAAYVLMSAYRYLPPGAIFVAVVDPGVGSSRKPIAVKTSHGVFIGPDNGLFSYVSNQIEVKQIVALHNRQYHLHETSATFHGRDIFSPVAAHLAKGVPFSSFGPPLQKMERLKNPRLEIASHSIRGEVLHIDRYGNLTTSIGRLRWNADDRLEIDPCFPPVLTGDIGELDEMKPFEAETCSVEIGEHLFEPIFLTYAAVAKGKPLALINSAGQLEISINQGNAAYELGISTGDMVSLHLEQPSFSDGMDFESHDGD